MLRPSRTARLHVDETKETEDNNKKKGAAVAINRKTDERERMREKGISETNKKNEPKGREPNEKREQKKTNKKKGGKRKVRTGTAAGNHIDSIRQLFGRSTVFHRHILFFFFFFFFFRRFCSFFIGRFFFIGRDTRPSLYRVFHRRWNLVATRRHRSRRRRR